MFATLKPTKIFLKSDGSLQILPLSTKFGQMELREICQLAQDHNWQAESVGRMVERARTMIDSSCASPKEHALIELESQNKIDVLDGTEYWIANINQTTAAVVHLNLDNKAVEVMVTNLQEFTPIIHCSAVNTLEQLKKLTHAN
ncbi:MAG: hypothetical protein WBA13_02480 [Microcoleaceae cyanobacterium]